MGGEARAAQAHDARVLDAEEDIPVGDGGRVLAPGVVLGGGELAVVVHHDAVGHRAHQREPLLDALHRAGAGADDMGGNKAVRLGDALAHQHGVALFHDGLGRLADVLGEREYHLARRQEFAQRDVPAQFLAPCRVNAAAKGVFHDARLPFII